MKAIIANMKRQAKVRAFGFSQVELIAAVAVLGILGSVALVVIGDTRGDIKNMKLGADVDTLNEAVQVYRANGGSMAGVTTVTGALTKLKKVADSASTATAVGIRGTMLDPRFEARMLSASEVASDKPRALWNSDKMRFVVDDKGAGGASEFYIDVDAAGDEPLTEARKTAVAYGTATDWVWDYEDTSLSYSAGTSTYTTTTSTPTPYTPVVPPTVAQLSPPSISVPAGMYNYYDFDLAVEISNPNPTGVSLVYYTIDDSHWNVYSGSSILVGADQTLKAYTVSLDGSVFNDSEFVSAHYGSTFTISGSASGDFLSPEGPEGMVTNLIDGESGNYFTFGTAAGTPDPSWLLFNGVGFYDVSADESFLLGSIDYYNGTILGGTQAVGVGLSVDLGFDGGTQSFDFGYELELISTPNLEGNTAAESADYVKLGNLYSDVPVQLGGVSYNLVLEFGETTSGGFSTIDQFHVVEGESASGNLYGRLVEVEEDEES